MLHPSMEEPFWHLIPTKFCKRYKTHRQPSNGVSMSTSASSREYNSKTQQRFILLHIQAQEPGGQGGQGPPIFYPRDLLIFIHAAHADRNNRSVYYIRPPQNGIASYAYVLGCFQSGVMQYRGSIASNKVHIATGMQCRYILIQENILGQHTTHIQLFLCSLCRSSDLHKSVQKLFVCMCVCVCVCVRVCVCVCVCVFMHACVAMLGGGGTTCKAMQLCYFWVCRVKNR